MLTNEERARIYIANLGKYTQSKLDNPEFLAKVIEDYKNGKSQSRLRDEIGCAPEVLKKRLIAAGIKSRTKAEAMALHGEKCRQRRKYKIGEYVRISNKQRSRLVWEQVHQKELPKGWHVHHINGITYDDRPENLIAMPDKNHVNFIPLLKKRIRELEIEVDNLRRALVNSETKPSDN